MSLNNNLTLEEGLQEFYGKYSTQLSHTDEGLPDEVKAFFRSHDIAHVLFGCDISLYGEGSVKIWTAFGSSLGFWKHIGEYKKANAYELSRKLNPSNIFRDLLKFLLAIPGLIIRAKQMKKPWPWSDFDDYLNTPIHEIRKEFNIRVK